MIDVGALHKIADAKRLNVDAAESALSDYRGERDAAEEVSGIDIESAANSLLDAIELLESLSELGLGLSSDDLISLRDAVQEFQNIDTETIEAIVEAFDAAEEAVEICVEHRDAERGEFDTEEKQEARENCQILLRGLAEALEAAAVQVPTVTPEVAEALAAVESALR
ncbi:MAG: hypothetical protein NVS3B1_17770 [Marmoricola sp.]